MEALQPLGDSRWRLATIKTKDVRQLVEWESISSRIGKLVFLIVLEMCKSGNHRGLKTQAQKFGSH